MPDFLILPDIVILIVAAFGAGVLNTIAGGGTFLTFPALVFVGVPPIIANATSAIAVFPGYAAGAYGFRAELSSFARPRLVRLVGITLAGGVAGSALLLVSSNTAFSMIVPFLLFGRAFWEKIINWDALAEAGTISADDLDLFRFVETAQEALEAMDTWQGTGTKRSAIPGR